MTSNSTAPLDEAVLIADDTWWVGVRLDDDRFQCHAYYLASEVGGVLIDPGSPLTIRATLDKIDDIADVDDIRYLVIHHPDPDIAASLGYLSERLQRTDIDVVTEWRAAALLKHYGHRFPYYLVEEHDWAVDLGSGRRLEFQLTPYLHFPGAMVSYDTATATLFSSDIFGGFVPDSAVLVSNDVDYIIENARPFHQHYMPSTELLRAGLTRIQQRWPRIDRIAPQHGHVIPGPSVEAAFEALKGIECGVFTLADADMDLKRLLRISEARSQITDALLTIADPSDLVEAMNAILRRTYEARECALFIDLPDRGWTMWGLGHPEPITRSTPPHWPSVTLPGEPAAVLAVHMADDEHPDPDLLDMLEGLALTMRPAVDQFLHEYEQERRVSDLATAATTDPLTGLGNRRALEHAIPTGAYSLIAFDLDHFKAINDTHGHAAGDAVLSGVADVVRATLRDGDHVYRVGGEEFLAVLRGAPAGKAAEVAERLRVAIANHDFSAAAPSLQVSASLGVTGVQDADRPDFAAVSELADEALYEAKAAGRNRVVLRASSI